MDNSSLVKIEEIRKEIDGAWIAGIGKVNMANIDHVMLAGYLIGKTESDKHHHKELMHTLDLFKRE